jgi:hypothetical protein
VLPTITPITNTKTAACQLSNDPTPDASDAAPAVGGGAAALVAGAPMARVCVCGAKKSILVSLARSLAAASAAALQHTPP